MDTITIICSVCAEFFASDDRFYQIRQRDRNVIISDAPAWIKDTNMFKWLLKQGSISFVDRSNQKQAENEPTKGMDAEGKREHLMTIGGPVEVKTEVAEEKPKKRVPRKKKDDAE